VVCGPHFTSVVFSLCVADIFSACGRSRPRARASCGPVFFRCFFLFSCLAGMQVPLSNSKYRSLILLEMEIILWPSKFAGGLLNLKSGLDFRWYCWRCSKSPFQVPFQGTSQIMWTPLLSQPAPPPPPLVPCCSQAPDASSLHAHHHPGYTSIVEHRRCLGSNLHPISLQWIRPRSNLLCWYSCPCCWTNYSSTICCWGETLHYKKQDNFWRLD
jgi:hypothetical protein